MALFSRKRPNFDTHIKDIQGVDYDLSSLSMLPQDVLREVSADQIARLSSDDIPTIIRPILKRVANDRGFNLSDDQEDFLVQQLIDDMMGFGPLEPLLADETVTDILVNGPTQVMVERAGLMQETDIVFRDELHVRHLATRIANRIGRRIDEAVPMVDARLPDDSRINMVIPPLSLTGTILSIRKFRKKGISLEEMEKLGTLSPELNLFLKKCLKARLNILVSGGTGAGKTTMLNALSSCIEPTERVITIEDTAELRLTLPQVIRLEARAPNLEGEGEITIRDLVRNSLRMRPDRLIVGEVRGAEVVDMLQALNTGHQGSMSTIHANEPKDALIRLENIAYLGGLKMDAFVLKQLILGAIDLIVHLERTQEGTRCVTAVSEIVGQKDGVWQLHDVYKRSLPLSSVMYETSMVKERIQAKFEKAGCS